MNLANIKLVMLFFGLFMVSSNGISNHKTTMSILGKWFASHIDNSVIEINKQDDGSLVGQIISSDNPDYVGKKVLTDFSFDIQTNAHKCTIHVLSNGMDVDGTLSVMENGSLKVLGEKLFMTKTFYWTPVTSQYKNY